MGCVYACMRVSRCLQESTTHIPPRNVGAIVSHGRMLVILASCFVSMYCCGKEKKGGSIDNPTENVEEKEEGREGSVDGWSRVSRENRVTVVIPWREQENCRHG